MISYNYNNIQRNWGEIDMDIVIVSQYLRDIEDFDNNNSRFVYLAKLLAEKPGNKVEIITSDFHHSEKKHFASVGMLSDIKVSALHESGYPKNICLKRFASHKELAKNIEKYLSERKRPDVCYCAVPSLDVSDAVAQYCRRENVRFIVDVQDLWPEAFKMVFRIPVLSDLLFAPMRRKANRIYSLADHVVAVSQTYADRAMRVNKKRISPTVVYLGTEKESFDDHTQGINDQTEDGVTVAYIGSMAASYDLISVIDAIADLSRNMPIQLLAMGDGALRDSFIAYAKEKGIHAEFPGRLPYSRMIERLHSCDIAVNPIRKGSAGSIINKVGDYAMAGLPVVNSQECQEYRDLLAQYQAGINCECENSIEIAEALTKLIADPDLRAQMSSNSRKLGTERFDRKYTYQRIVDVILKGSERTYV